MEVVVPSPATSFVFDATCSPETPFTCRHTEKYSKEPGLVVVFHEPWTKTLSKPKRCALHRWSSDGFHIWKSSQYTTSPRFCSLLNACLIKAAPRLSCLRHGNFCVDVAGLQEILKHQKMHQRQIWTYWDKILHSIYQMLNSQQQVQRPSTKHIWLSTTSALLILSLPRWKCWDARLVLELNGFGNCDAILVSFQNGKKTSTAKLKTWALCPICKPFHPFTFEVLNTTLHFNLISHECCSRNDENPMDKKRNNRKRHLPRSLVTLGAPKLCSMTTLRPLGPKVTATASARRSAPGRSRWQEQSISPWSIFIFLCNL